MQNIPSKPGKALNTAAWNPTDGVRLVIGGDCGEVSVWHGVAGMKLGVLTQLPTGVAVTLVSWDPRGDRLLVGGSDSIARVYRTESTGYGAKLIQEISCGETRWEIASASWAPLPPDQEPGMPKREMPEQGFGTKDIIVISASFGDLGKAVVYDAERGQLLGELDSPGVVDTSMDVDYINGGKSCCTVAADGVIRIFDISPRFLAIPYEILAPEPEDMVEGEEKIDNSAKQVKVSYQLQEGSDEDPDMHPPLLCASYDPEGKKIAIGNENGEIKIWDLALSGKEIQNQVAELKAKEARISEEVAVKEEALQIQRSQSMRKVRETWSGEIGKLAGIEGQKLQEVEVISEKIELLRSTIEAQKEKPPETTTGGGLADSNLAEDLAEAEASLVSMEAEAKECTSKIEEAESQMEREAEDAALNDTAQLRNEVGGLESRLSKTQDDMEALESKAVPKTLFNPNAGAIMSLRWGKDGKEIVSGGGDGYVDLWSLDIEVERNDPAYANSIPQEDSDEAYPTPNVTPADKDDANATTDESPATPPPAKDKSPTIGGKVVIDHMWTSISTHGDAVVSLDIWPPQKGKYLCTVGSSSVRVWEVEMMADAEEIEGAYTTIQMSPNGKMLAIGSADGSVSVWDTESDVCITRLIEAPPNAKEKDLPPQVSALTFTKDSNSLATGDIVGEVRIWSTLTWELNSTLKAIPHEGAAIGVKSLAFSPFGKRCNTIAVAHDFGVRLWDFSSESPSMWGVLSEKGGVMSRPKSIPMVWSPNGAYLAVAMKDTVQLWDAMPGNLIQTFELRTIYGSLAQDDLLTTLAYAPDGKSLLASGGRHVTIWDVGRPEDGRVMGSVLSKLALERMDEEIAMSISNWVDGSGISGWDDLIVGRADGKLKKWSLKKAHQYAEMPEIVLIQNKMKKPLSEVEALTTEIHVRDEKLSTAKAMVSETAQGEVSAAHRLTVATQTLAKRLVSMEQKKEDLEKLIPGYDEAYLSFGPVKDEHDEALSTLEPIQADMDAAKIDEKAAVKHAREMKKEFDSASKNFEKDFEKKYEEDPEQWARRAEERAAQQAADAAAEAELQAELAAEEAAEAAAEREAAGLPPLETEEAPPAEEAPANEKAAAVEEEAAAEEEAPAEEEEVKELTPEEKKAKVYETYLLEAKLPYEEAQEAADICTAILVKTKADLEAAKARSKKAEAALKKAEKSFKKIGDTKDEAERESRAAVKAHRKATEEMTAAEAGIGNSGHASIEAARALRFRVEDQERRYEEERRGELLRRLKHYDDQVLSLLEGVAMDGEIDGHDCDLIGLVAAGPTVASASRTEAFVHHHQLL